MKQQNSGNISSNQQLFVGIDEAGYGPNLGPLVICGSAWLAPGGMTEQQLCEHFSQIFRPKPWHADCQHVPLGDSKKLYHPSQGLTSLEVCVLAMLECKPTAPQILNSLACLLDATQIPSSHHTSIHPDLAAGRSAPIANLDRPEIALPWYDALHLLSVPESQELSGEIRRLSQLARQWQSHHGIQLVGLQSVLVREPEFNAAIQHSGSKGQLLSQTTMQLVADLLSQHGDYPAQVFCDRQGGRKNYLPILFDAMPERWFTQTRASNARSSYRSSDPPVREIHFTVGGDSFPPTALASMLAKYLRERTMQSFNAFWKKHIPTIKPTAGYPQDAKRFRAQIESKSRDLHLPPEYWWRCR